MLAAQLFCFPAGTSVVSVQLVPSYNSLFALGVPLGFAPPAICAAVSTRQNANPVIFSRTLGP